MDAKDIQAKFPEKLQCLFLPKRYKVLFGGRGGAKSWGVARFLLLEAVKREIRVLCAREFQNSIKDSVHKLLSDQIISLGLQDYFDIQKDSIICRATGSEFIFKGIKQNVSTMKSYEGVDYCWVEEAQTVSDNSWNILIPTIRKAGSEIIITMNPDLETDATYVRFIKDPPKEAFIVKLTYRDNEWFPDVLREEMEELKEKNYDDYLWVWEGNCRTVLEGAVYADELREATAQQRITDVKWDKAFPVDAYFDLGRSDHTSIWFVQRAGFEFHLIDFYQNNLKHIDHYLGLLQARGYLYGNIWLPHDAQAKTLGSKMSIEEQARAKFPSLIRITPRLSVADGINAARTVFSNCWFDALKCADGIQALRHYSYAIDATTKQYSRDPLHNEYSDAADAFRYFAVACKIPARKRVLNMLEPFVHLLEERREYAGSDHSPGLNWMR